MEGVMPDTLDLGRLEKLLAEATPGTDASCPDCGGYGERFVHSPDCDNDRCALAGDIDDCDGRVEPCLCLDKLITETRTALPHLLSRISELESALREAEANLAAAKYAAKSWEKACEQAQARADASDAALAPFKQVLDDWGDEPDQPDDRDIWEHPVAMNLTLGHLRQARNVLGEKA
jgi:hypothetical protein